MSNFREYTIRLLFARKHYVRRICTNHHHRHNTHPRHTHGRSSATKHKHQYAPGGIPRPPCAWGTEHCAPGAPVEEYPKSTQHFCVCVYVCMCDQYEFDYGNILLDIGCTLYCTQHSITATQQTVARTRVSHIRVCGPFSKRSDYAINGPCVESRRAVHLLCWLCLALEVGLAMLLFTLWMFAERCAHN